MFNNVEHEMEIGQEGMAYGFINEVKPRCLEVDNFKIVMWIDGTEEIDVTSIIPEKTLEHFKERFIEHFVNHMPKEAV